MSSLPSRNPWYLFSNIASVSSELLRTQYFFFTMILGSEDVSQEGGEVSRPRDMMKKGMMGTKG